MSISVNSGISEVTTPPIIVGRLLGANMNSTADQAFHMVPGLGKIVLVDVIVTNASTSLTTAVGGVYNATGKPAGGILLAAATAYSGLTASTKYIFPTIATLATTDLLASTTPIQLSLTTPQGSAATADFYLIGYVLI